MDLKHFLKYTDPKIIGRGFAYLSGGAVKDLYESAPGMWLAKVQGTRNYKVEIRLDDNLIIDWNCSCPYDHGDVCKHVVAVLYAIEEELDPGEFISQKPNQRKTENEQIQEIFQNVTKDELQNFIEEMFRADLSMRQRFLVHFSDRIAEEDPEQKYRSLIDHCYMAAEGEFGYVDYYPASELDDTLHELNKKAEELFYGGNNRESFAICKVIIEEVTGLLEFIDDSDGGAWHSIESAFETLNKLAIKADNQIKNELFDWCMDEISKPVYDKYGSGSYYFLYLFPDIIHNGEQEKRFFDLIERRIGVQKAKSFPEYGTGKLIRAKIDYLDLKGRQKEKDALVEAYSYIPDFREMKIERALELGEHQEAVQLCLDGIEIARQNNHYGVVNRWREKLFQISESVGDTAGVLKWAEVLFFENYYSREWYRKLKAAWPEKSWKEKSEELIARIQKENSKGWRSGTDSLAEIFIEEGYIGRLYELVVRNGSDIGFVRRYAGVLKKSYPNEILGLYEKAVRKYAQQTGRNVYREITFRVKEMKEIKGGNEQADNLLKDLLLEYPNRPAMEDEFKKAFPISIRPF